MPTVEIYIPTWIPFDEIKVHEIEVLPSLHPNYMPIPMSVIYHLMFLLQKASDIYKHILMSIFSTLFLAKMTHFFRWETLLDK